MYLSHTIVCLGANDGAWHSKVQRGAVVFRLVASGASGFGCFVHAAHSSAAFTLELSLRLLPPLLTPQMNPHNQDPDSISCPQPLGLDSKHLSLLFITQVPCEDMIPSAIVHGIMPPHMLWRDSGAFRIRGSGPSAGAAGHLNLYPTTMERSDCGGERFGLYPGRERRAQTTRILFHCPPQVPSPQKAQKGKKGRRESGWWGLPALWGGVRPTGRAPIWCSVATTPWGVSSGGYLDPSKTRHIFL